MALSIMHADLLRLLSYDPATGIFRWREKMAHRVLPGAIAGKINVKGYRQIKIAQKWYYAHRLAWFYVTGAWPTNFIDHVNNLPADNRFCNLRDVTNSQNAWNSKRRKNNKCGYKWVFLRRGRFLAALRDGQRQVVLGSFTDPKTAFDVAISYARTKHGAFMRAE